MLIGRKKGRKEEGASEDGEIGKVRKGCGRRRLMACTTSLIPILVAEIPERQSLPEHRT